MTTFCDIVNVGGARVKKNWVSYTKLHSSGYHYIARLIISLETAALKLLTEHIRQVAFVSDG